jgi:cobalt-zinc-cadmium resistance protein CzcA
MNGILLVTYFKQARFRGETSMNAIFFAAYTRMRPILMTSFSACIGLVPAAISTGIGSQVQRPLATVIVGGMLFGPIMLLIVVPALKAVFLAPDRNAAPVAQTT